MWTLDVSMQMHPRMHAHTLRYSMYVHGYDLIVITLTVFCSCRVVLVATESLKKTQEQKACIVSAEQPLMAAKQGMGTSCQVVLYSSPALSSTIPPSGKEVISAVLKARQDVSELCCCSVPPLF